MDDANRIALEKAFELYGRHQGQPWSAENLVTAAEKFRGFLDAETTMEPLVERLVGLEKDDYLTQRNVQNLDSRLTALEATLYPPQAGDRKAKPTRQPSASAATSTTHPDDEPLDLAPDDVPTPIDF